MVNLLSSLSPNQGTLFSFSFLTPQSRIVRKKSKWAPSFESDVFYTYKLQVESYVASKPFQYWEGGTRSEAHHHTSSGQKTSTGGSQYTTAQRLPFDVMVHRPSFPSIPRKDHIKTDRKLHHLSSSVRQSGPSPSIQAGVSIRLTPLPFRSGPREDQNSIEIET